MKDHLCEFEEKPKPSQVPDYVMLLIFIVFFGWNLFEVAFAWNKPDNGMKMLTSGFGIGVAYGAICNKIIKMFFLKKKL